MGEHLPHIRVRTAQGNLVARDGIILCFFMRRSQGEIAPAIWRALQTYLRAIPPHSLAWYIDQQGDTEPLDDDGWAFTRQEILERPWPASSRVELLELESEAGGYNFEYRGLWLDAPLFARDESATCAVAFTLPTEYLLEQGPARVRALALELARELPFSFGYASLAFVSPGGSWYSAREELLPLLSRYLGLDLYVLRKTCQVIGTRARGAYWLTFLGQPLLAQLGGLESLQRKLLFPEVSIQPLEGERALLTLGEWPDAIDTRQELSLPHLRALAHLLEPFLCEEEIGLTSIHDRENMRRWLRRLSQ